MATKSIRKTFQTFMSWFLHSSDDTSVNNTSKICWFSNLPLEILQMITDYLNLHDIISLSQTCRMFHTFINDDIFWIHVIRNRFSPSIAQLYTYDLYQIPENIQTNDETRPSGLTHVRNDSELDLLVINSATHYNDEAIERRRAKMYISKEDFLNNIQYFQYEKPKNNLQIPFMKLIYLYLIDRKRTAAVNTDVIHRGHNFLIEQRDVDSLTGRIIYLRNVCWLEITGRFEHDIMPGKYDAIWRMKGNQGGIQMWGETEFIVVPSHGKMLIKKISEHDFQNYVLENGNHWFLAHIGQIIIYELSTVLMAIRNWHDGNWKSGISWDCIELKLAP